MRYHIFKIYYLKKLLLMAAALFLVAAVVINPAAAIDSGRASLALCANVLIPSLFPFFVLSGLLINMGFARVAGRLLSPVMRPLFGVSGNGALALALGVISGYPLGASCVCDLYSQGYINKQESERLLAFCNNSGPLFIIGSVGAAMYHNPTLGMLLYITHIAASVSVGVILRIFGGNVSGRATVPRSALQSQSFGKMLSDVMGKSVSNMLMICGFTIFFGVVITMLQKIFHGTPGLVLSGILEISTGLNSLLHSGTGMYGKIIATAAIIGFAGFGVHCQVLGILSGTGLKFGAYLKGKLMHAVFAVLYMCLALRWVPLDTAAFAPITPLYPVDILDFRTAMSMALLYLAGAIVFVVIIWITGWILERKTKRNG